MRSRAASFCSANKSNWRVRDGYLRSSYAPEHWLSIIMARISGAFGVVGAKKNQTLFYRIGLPLLNHSETVELILEECAHTGVEAQPTDVSTLCSIEFQIITKCHY